MTQEQVSRDVVSVGIDFRPLPVNIGDGVIWNFDPDPSPEAWGQLMDQLKALAALGSIKEGDTDAAMELDVKGLLNGLTEALSGLLLEDEQRAKFKSKGYGLAVLSKTAPAIVKALSGFPTTSPSSSGEGSETDGSTE